MILLSGIKNCSWIFDVPFIHGGLTERGSLCDIPSKAAPS